MAETSVSMNPFEKRGSLRIIVDKYYTVEFFAKSRNFHYKFKIRDASSKGMCILVEKDSPLLAEIEVGDVLDMKYYPTNRADSPKKPARVRIAHITEAKRGKIVMVGLSVLEHQSEDPLIESLGMQIED